MKKYIIAALCAAGMAFGAMSETKEAPKTVAQSAAITDTYTFKMCATRMPYLKDGVRSYTSQTLKGKLYVEYAEEGGVATRAYAEVENAKTKVQHSFEFDEAFINALGKSSPKVIRTIPVIYGTAADLTTEKGEGKNAADAHELFTVLNFAGSGQFKYTVTTGCGVCGVASKTTCAVVNKLSGNFNGVVDCECPEDEKWNHTVQLGSCGPLEGETEDVRSHLAPVWGSWSATFKSREYGN